MRFLVVMLMHIYKICVDISWIDPYEFCKNFGPTLKNGIMSNSFVFLQNQ